MALDFLESVNHHLTHLHQHLLPKICLLVNAALATAAACLVIGSRGKGFKAFFEILPLETPSNFDFPSKPQIPSTSQLPLDCLSAS